MKIIELQHIYKTYDLDSTAHESVLRDVNLSIKDGEFLIIEGPSGGGKTTILNIISGLDTEYEGTLLYKDKVLTGISATDLTSYREQNIGFVFQTFNLIPHLSVIENVILPMKMNNTKNAKKRALNLLDKVGMKPYFNKNVTKLSGGQKQRVAIARALANNPNIIIADEPTGSLDSKSQSKIMKILRGLADEGKTIIVVTHNNEILSYGDRVVYVKDGQISNQDSNLAAATDKQKRPQYEPLKSHINYQQIFKIGWKNFRQRIWRNIIIALAMSIGLIGVLLSLGLGNGITKMLQSEDIKNQIPTTIQIQANPESGIALNTGDSASIKKAAGKKLKYISNIQNYSLTQVKIKNKKLVFKNEHPNYAQLSNLVPDVSESRKLLQIDGVSSGQRYKNIKEHGLTVTKKFIKEFNQTNHTKYTVKSILNQDIALTVQMGNNNVTHKTKIIRVQNGDNAMFLSTMELNQLVGSNPKQIAYYLLELKNPKNNDTVLKKINRNKKFNALSSGNILKTVIQFINVIQGLLIFMSLQAIIVSICMLGIVLFINVIERTKEIGIMKSLGYQNKDIAGIFISEGMCIAIISYLTAVIVSVIIGQLINVGVNHFAQFTVNVYQTFGSALLIVFLATVFMVLIAIFVPIRKINKLDAAESIRYE